MDNKEPLEGTTMLAQWSHPTSENNHLLHHVNCQCTADLLLFLL